MQQEVDWTIRRKMQVTESYIALRKWLNKTTNGKNSATAPLHEHVEEVTTVRLQNHTETMSLLCHCRYRITLNLSELELMRVDKFLCCLIMSVTKLGYL